MNKRPLLSAQKLVKSYQQGTGELPILKGLSIDIYPGEAIGIQGASGSGKSTLLHILGTLDRPQSGELFFEDRNLSVLNDEELSQFRNREMGFVFQFHHLVSEFTAIENVALPCRVAGESKKQSLDKAKELLEVLGLGGRFDHYPNQLSGGELQRVAIARALVQKPKLLFADEPTGNLDTNNSRKVQDLFFDLQSRFNLTMVIVTHDENFAKRFPRRQVLRDGLWASVD
jgi:lipoprotein-releasing system ATP-binding protein